jgi:hypothetical protein
MELGGLAACFCSWNLVVWLLAFVHGTWWFGCLLLFMELGGLVSCFCSWNLVVWLLAFVQEIGLFGRLISTFFGCARVHE